MKQFLFVVLCLSQIKAASQFNLGNLVDSLDENRFYAIGQLHNNKANTLIEHELLIWLNKHRDVRFDVLEYAHSAAFLVNNFLETGEDSFLAFINPRANFKFIRRLKTHNDTLPSEKKILFYGIDFEGRADGTQTKKAVEIIINNSKIPNAHPLRVLLNNIINSPGEALKDNISTLKDYLARNEEESRLFLGRYFLDVKLIANARYGFASGRDDEMFASFKLLYNELSKNVRPRFVSSLGIGHINPDNRRGIAMRLLDDEESPVQGNVAIIGIQYINCGFDKDGTRKASEGSLNFLCSNSSIKKRISNLQNESEAIGFVSKDELVSWRCNKEIKKLSGLFIVKNFVASEYWVWE